MARTLDLQDWQTGIGEELHFWRSFLMSKGHWYKKSRCLRKDIRFLIRGLERAQIADCGSGAVSMIGDSITGTQVEVVASDVLADRYDALCAELGVERFIPVEKQDMSHMSYGDGSFDVVWCRNALDHSLDPWSGIREMVRICRPGGWLILTHFAHVGKRMGYRGLHTWDIDATPGGDCEFSAQGQSFLLSECVPGFAVTALAERRPKVLCVLRKEGSG